MTDDRRIESRRCIDQVIKFNECPKYVRHDLTDAQILEIAVKAVNLAKDEAKIEMFDAGFGFFKKAIIMIGAMVILLNEYWHNILHYFMLK